METLSKRNEIDQMKKKVHVLGMILVVIILLIGLVAVGSAIKINGESSENPPPPFRITKLADHESLCAAINESEDFEGVFSPAGAVYVSCQDDGGKSVFTCFSDGSLLSLTNFCENTDFKACGCEPGQIIDARTLLGGFADMCLDEFHPGSEICVELQGDLEGLLKPRIPS